VRAQLRRAQRGFGELSLDVAADEREAADIYGELVRLHGLRWRARGQPGAFADPWFDRFHRRLIAERFRHGEIQLLRLRAGATTLGCLYNLVAGGRVLFYQSGLESFADPHLKPGYLCHAAAIRHNAAAGHAVYDLLAGASRYKQSLATDEVELVWARIQRPLCRFAIEERVRVWKRAVTGVRQVRR
jgi:CelD/BcsL family acetyltransferase involved in cellulose biosynthesis